MTAWHLDGGTSSHKTLQEADEITHRADSGIKKWTFLVNLLFIKVNIVSLDFKHRLRSQVITVKVASFSYLFGEIQCAFVFRRKRAEATWLSSKSAMWCKLETNKNIDSHHLKHLTLTSSTISAKVFTPQY